MQWLRTRQGEMIQLETPSMGGGEESPLWHCNATSYQEGSAQPQKMSVPWGVEWGTPGQGFGILCSEQPKESRQGLGHGASPEGSRRGCHPGPPQRATTTSTMTDRCRLWGGREAHPASLGLMASPGQ